MQTETFREQQNFVANRARGHQKVLTIKLIKTFKTIIELNKKW